MLNTRFWGKYFEVYDYLNVLIPYQLLLDTIVKKLELKKVDKVLDAGSGTGNLSIIMEKYGANVISFDFSKAGQALHRLKQPQASLVHGDLTKKLPFKDNTFDKIVSNNTIYTLPEVKRDDIFKEFYRVIKPNGIIVISNISEGFSPKKIYLEHFRLSVKSNGFFRTLVSTFKLLVPTFKIFYYNYLIKKENGIGSYSFLNENKQNNLLAKNGFLNIENGVRVYAEQAILNKATKI